MATREETPDTALQSVQDGAEQLVELRDVNEQLLIAGLREQELAMALEAERADLAVILSSISDAVFVVDDTGTLRRTNAAYHMIVGSADAPLVPQDEQGRPLPPQETPQARAARGETFSQEFTITGADGGRRWFEAKGQPLGDHRSGQGVVVIRDITLSSQQRHLQDEFLALASHELRTPLTSVQGYLSLLLRRLQRDHVDGPLIGYATLAHDQAYHLGVLVRDLTDVARLQSGRLTLSMRVVDMGQLTTHVCQTARDLPPGHLIDLDASLDPLPVRGDAGRLEQVLLNLLTNAFAYASSATPITVRLRRDGSELVLEVQDYGRGIAADQLPQLFTRFYQVQDVNRSSQSGLGLGLFICHEIVAAHGGRITVASTEGVGTTFTIWLPLIVEAG